MNGNEMRYFLRIASVLCVCAAYCGANIAAGQDIRPADTVRTATAGTFRKSEAQKYIDLKMEEEPFRSGLAGILAVTVRGDTLAEYCSRRKMIPASNMKLVTTGLALNGLGTGYRFTTRLGYTGHVADGILHGDLYIIGGGDPTLASGDKMAPSADSLFSMWKSALIRAGIKKIDGLVIGDGRFFDGGLENENWSYNDLGTDYGAGGNGLCFNRNIQTFSVSPTAPGSPVEASAAYPSTPWLRFRVNAVTASAGSGDNLYLFDTDMAPVAELRGSLGIDKGKMTLKGSNKFGALTCAWNFAQYLKHCGIAVSGAADVDAWGDVREAGQMMLRGVEKPSSRRAAEAADIHEIGRFRSPSLLSIARVTNERSDNFYAETLYRMLSKERTGSACYDSAAVMVLRELEALGVDCSTGVRIVDGSGLARHNYLSPDFFCRFLSAMAGTQVAGTYAVTLSPAGGSRLRGYPESLRSRVRMKSGSMNGVLCYSGYILPVSAFVAGKALPEDTVVFSIMTNNIVDGQSSVRSFIDTLLAMLSR